MNIKRKISKVKFLDIKSLIFLILAYPIALYIKYYNKNIWLISERPNDARDNGYFLFKFIRENYPNKNVYYAINKNSVDFSKVEILDNYIEFGSFRHYIYYLAASKNISSHIGTGEPNGKLCLNLEILGVIKNKKIFLQHGITKDIIQFGLYENSKVSLFICGAKPEYDFVKKEFGYPDGGVKYLGFCRFDSLHDFRVNKKQILLMPTWRHWLDFEGSRNEFLESEYFKTYNELINNKEMIDFLLKEDINLVFYPHDNMQKYLKYFKSTCRNIIIANKKEYDIQQLLKESALLVTDYSSVFFDFAYMRKPIIYYQFDYERFRSNQYKEGYFVYSRDSFGPICSDTEETVNQIIQNYNNDFELNDDFYDKIESFFPLFDGDNCKRTFEAINALDD